MKANFWWGSGLEGQRFHWQNWEKLCRAKKDEGLGFRRLEEFNQALLAKQAWRLARSLDSLAARVMAGKYHPNSSIFEGKVKSGYSYVWRSLVWGIDL